MTNKILTDCQSYFKVEKVILLKKAFPRYDIYNIGNTSFTFHL